MCKLGQTTLSPIAAQWPWLTNSFVSANQPQFADDESIYYGPYTRLLYYLFTGIEGRFEISPRFTVSYPPYGPWRRLWTRWTNIRCSLSKLTHQDPLPWTLNTRRRMIWCATASALFSIALVSPGFPVSVHSALAWPFMNTCLQPHGSLRLRLYNNGPTTSLMPTVPLEFSRWPRKY